MTKQHSFWRRFASSILLATLALLISSLAACKQPLWGLGGQVDITAPQISITSPTRNEYTRGIIKFEGQANDDIEVTKIRLVIKRNAVVILERDLSVDGDKWSVDVDSSDGSLDGALIIEARAYDSKGSESSAVISAFVDNSPPTVLVTNPVGLDSVLSEYIDLKGEVFDDSPLQSVMVELLADNGSTLAGPKLADGTNTWSVRFLLKGEISALPGVNEGVAQYRYKVTVIDLAGNQNAYYFHRSDIIRIKDPSAPFPSMDEIGRADQRGINGPSGVTPEELKGIRMYDLSKFARFTYDPAPQIDFQYTNIVRSDDGGLALTNLLAPKSKITGLITPPPNGGKIEPESIIVRIFDYAYDGSGDTSQYLLTEISQSSNHANFKAIGVGDSINFAFSLKIGEVDLAPNKYKFTINARTDTGIERMSKLEEFTVDAEAPTFYELNLDPDQPKSQFKNGPFTMRFSGSHSSALEKIEVFQSYEGGAFEPLPSISFAPGVNAFDDISSISLPHGGLANGRYSYRAVLHTSGGKTTTILRTITYDTVAPTVTVVSFDRFVPTTNKVNGIVDFYAVSSEKYGLEGTKYFVSNSATPPGFDAAVGGDIALVLAEQRIDTTTLADGATYYLWIVSRDLSGNVGNNAAPLSIHVDQATDRPIVAINTLDASIQDEGSINKDNNLRGAIGVIGGTVSDDDGVGGAAITIWDAMGTAVVDAQALSLSGFGASKSFSYPITSIPGLGEGSYRFAVTAFDDRSPAVQSAAMAPVWFAYDVSNPIAAINPNAADGQSVGPFRNGDFIIEGSVQDASGIVKAEFSLDGGVTWADLGVSVPSSAPASWSRAVSAATSGQRQLVVRATDRYGRVGQSGSVSVMIDVTAPSVAITPFGAGYFAGDTLRLRGTASDAHSQIDKLEFLIDLNGNGLQEAEGADGVWAAIDDFRNPNWDKDAISLVGVPEGPGRIVWVRATDRAGNSAQASSSFTIDRYAPTLALNAGFDGAVFRNAAFSISGTVEDTNLGGSPISISARRNNASHVLTPPLSYDSGAMPAPTWGQLININGTGIYEITITATDAVGRQTVEKRSVTVDQTPPTLLISSLLPILDGSKVNGRIVASVAASDANGIEAVRYFIRSDGSTPLFDDQLNAPMSGELSAPYAAYIDTTQLNDGMSYRLWIIAKDRAGNEAMASTTFNVDQASDIPTASIDTPSPGAQLGADRRLRGTFSDDDGIAASGATLHIRKQGAGTYTARNLNLSAAAGQLVAWSYDASADLAAGDGLYEVYLRVGDNVASKQGLGQAVITTPTVSFFYDVNPPTVSAITRNPVKPAYRIGDAITLEWTAVDASGIGSQLINVDGATDGLSAVENVGGDLYRATYTVTAATGSGIRIFTAIVTDGTGKTTARSLSIVADALAPVVENAFTVNPSFIGSVPNGAFALRGTASDDRGLHSVEISFSTDDVSYGPYQPASLSSGAWAWSIADSSTLIPSAGTLYFRVRAVDQAGNQSVVREFSQNVDQGADKPTVTLISPVAASTYGTTVQISGTAFDDDGLAGSNPIAADAIQIEYRGVSPAAAPIIRTPSIVGSGRNANFNVALSELGSGSWLVRARARDLNGLWGEWTGEVPFTVNAGAPNLTVDTILDSFRSNATLTLSGSVADGQGVKYVRVRINGGAWVEANPGSGSWGAANTSDSWSRTLNLGSDGLKTLDVQAADMGDFVSSLQLSTTLDQTPPSGSFDVQFRDHPSGSFLDTAKLNKLVRITGTAAELNLAEVSPIELSINGGAWAPVTGTFVWSYVWDTSALSNGDYTLRLRISDKAGNLTDTIEKTVTTAQAEDLPRISQAFLPAPAEENAGTNILGSLLRVSGTIADDDGFVAGAVKIFLDGALTPINASNGSGATATWEHTWASLSHGTHYYLIEATDRNGQSSSLGPTYFLVDNSNPVLSIASPALGARIREGNLVIAGTATDDGGLGVAPLLINLRHSSGAASPLHGLSYAPQITGDSFSQSVSVSEASLDGTLFIDFILTDRSGKQANVTRTVTIDTTPPVLNLGYPSSGAYMNGFISFRGTADDLNGLSDVTLQLLSPTPPYLPVATIARSGSTLASWEFPFNLDSYATSAYGADVNGNGKLWKLLFRLAATDRTGNTAVYKVANPANDDWPFFYIDLDGDKPTISVTQPAAGANIGGIVNMFGTASDDDGPVMRVEVQIDFNGDGLFSSSHDINNNDSVESGGTLNEYQIGPENYQVRIGDPSQPWEDESVWYAFPVSNNSWSLELNVNGEFYATKTGGNGFITIRTRSRDRYGLPSEISARTIRLDETFPRIENVSPADKSYRSGIFPFRAEFGDDADLNLSGASVIRININKSGFVTLVPGANSGPGWSGALTSDLGEPQNGYDLALNINSNHFFNASSGIFYVDLYVKDESGYVNQRGYTYYIDNQAPTSAWSNRPGAPDGLNLRNGQVRINNNPTLDYALIEGNYLDSGVVSGIDRVEVYFVRDGFVRKINSAGPNRSAAASASVPLETYSEASGQWSATNQTLPYARHADAGFGDDYVIKIDRATEMSSISTGVDTDGDGYYEFMGLDGGGQRFRAYFDSRLLPDGEIDIHYVVYDMAGNSVHRVRRGFIANNGPSFNRIRIGSDYNNSGTIADVAGAATEILDYFHPSGGIDRLASNQPVRIKNGRLFFAVDSADPNGTIQSTVINIVAPSPGLRGTLTTFGGATGNAVATDPSIPISVSIGSTQFPVAGDYTLEVIVKDNDGISARRNLVITVLNTADLTRPTVSITPMTQGNAIPLNGNDKRGHLELQSDNTTPVWNAIKALYGNDDDPKVSGEINLRGTAFDENRIVELSISAEGVGDNLIIANWSGGRLVSADPRLVIDAQTLSENGHALSFTYVWNSAVVSGTAGLNKIVAFRARDAATPTANQSDPHGSLRFDVVPYISAIERDPTLYNTYRSRLGGYSLRQGEALRFKGFNIWNSTTDSVRFSNVSGTTTSYPLPAGQSSTGFTHASLNADVSSGPVQVTVNGLPSLNNHNDNGKDYNKEATPAVAFDGSALWTDDRTIHVWRSDDNQTGANRGYFTGSDDPEYPAMSIDGSGILYGSWSNYAMSRVYFGVNNDARTQIYTGYDPSEHTDIHFGLRPTVAFNANLYMNAGWNVGGAGGTYVWDNRATNVNDYTGTPTGGVYNAEALYHDQKLMQFVNQRIVTNGDNIHISYYDTDTKALKYWYRLSGTNSPYAQTWINVDGGSDTHDGSRVVATGRSNAAGEFSAIDLTPGNRFPVIAYYDITNRTLRLARSRSINPSAAQWSLQTVMAPGDPNYLFSGKFVSMKIDSLGFVHLAFFRNSTGDLIYMRSTNNPTDGSQAYTFGPSVIIDSIGSVGVWADLTLLNNQPYISYLDSSMVNTFDGIKMAYYDPLLESEAGDLPGQPDTIDGWDTFNAALGYEVENVRTSIETDTGSNFWQQAIGYSSNDFFRIAYYVRR